LGEGGVTQNRRKKEKWGPRGGSGTRGKKYQIRLLKSVGRGLSRVWFKTKSSWGFEGRFFEQSSR